jgi:hypothetical protein
MPCGRTSWPARANGGLAVLPRSSSAGGVQPIAAHEVFASGWNVQRHLSDEVQRGVAADPALEVPRGGREPSDGVLLFVPTDALQGDRGSHDVLAQRLARGLVEDAGPALDGETRMLPEEDLAGEVGIQQALV